MRDSGADSGDDSMSFEVDDIDICHALPFLGTDLGPWGKGNKRVKRTTGLNDKPTNFEKKGRKWSEVIENHAGHLMVKDKSGKWKNPIVAKDNTSSSDLEEAELPLPASHEEPSNMSMREWSTELSLLGKSVTECPEDSFGKLRKLGDFYKTRDFNRRFLAMASAVAIFRDILPSYSIRSLSEAEKVVKISKEVQAVRSYEQGILGAYTEFISYCKSEYSKRHCELSYKSLCELCRSTSVRSFNHFESILSVVSCAAAGSPNQKIRLLGCATMKFLFVETEDTTGRQTMLSLKAISGVLRSLAYAVRNRELFEALECVRLRAPESLALSSEPTLAGPDKGKIQSHMSKRERKEAKEEKKKSRKQAGKESADAVKQQQKWARESRVQLFGILFGYLKSEKRDDRLLPCCLSAIGKFSAFLGVEYFADLTNVIKSLVIFKHGKASVILALHCIVAVLRMAEFQDNSSTLDLKFFFDLYYRLLGTPDQLHPHMDMEKQVFTMLFLAKKSLPRERVASFAHRLCLASITSCGEIRAQFALHLCDLFLHYPLIRPLLDNEPLGNGAFLEKCDDSDVCKPFCRKLSFGNLLEDPQCSHFIKKILK